MNALAWEQHIRTLTDFLVGKAKSFQNQAAVIAALTNIKDFGPQPRPIHWTSYHISNRCSTKHNRN
jgi:hypothetical protein